MNEKKEFLIMSLKKAAEHFESSTLTMSQYLRYQSNYSPESPSLQMIYKYLGRWDVALEIAGLKKQENRYIRCARCGNKYDPSMNKKYCQPCESKPTRKNIKIPKYKKYTSSEIVKSLQNAGSQTKGPLTIQAYDILNFRPSSGTIRNHFGSWSQALKNAGLYDNYCNYPSKLYKFSNEFLLEHLQRVCIQSGKSDLTAIDYKNVCSNPSVSTYCKRFGSWSEALKLCKLSSTE